MLARRTRGELEDGVSEWGWSIITLTSSDARGRGLSLLQLLIGSKKSRLSFVKSDETNCNSTHGRGLQTQSAKDAGREKEGR